MLVIVLESAPPKAVGYCSSWALQVATNVYVANLPAGIRDEIWWQLVDWADRDTKIVMAWSSNQNEQGIAYRTRGSPRRTITDREGLLISTWLPSEPSEDDPE